MSGPWWLRRRSNVVVPPPVRHIEEGASFASWALIGFFLTCATFVVGLVIVYPIFVAWPSKYHAGGCCRRVATALRQWALRRPETDLFHQLTRYAMNTVDRRAWAKFADDPDEDERVSLVVDTRSAGPRSSPIRQVGAERVPDVCGPDALGREMLPLAVSHGLPESAKPMIGRWRTIRTENYDEFLKIFNMSWCAWPEQKATYGCQCALVRPPRSPSPVSPTCRPRRPIRKIAEQIKPQPTWYEEEGVLHCSTVCSGATTIHRVRVQLGSNEY